MNGNFEELFGEDDGQWVTLRHVADVLEKHLSTVVRWTVGGVRGHRLPTKFIGGRRHANRADVVAFLNAINGDDEPVAISVSAEEKARRKRVNDELVAKGF